MPSEEKILVRRFYEEIINKARLDRLDEILDSKTVFHNSLLPTGAAHGIENFKKFLEVFRSAFSDLFECRERRSRFR